ncbi:MAG: hypothetical protein R3264_03795, partial [Anaerolineae bacterium]|nr:hypothetical protein [Anaerolineae bacterium]
CAAATDPDDETCPGCKQQLWSQTLRRKKPSLLYRALLWTHIVSNITYLSVVSLVLQASVNIGLLAPMQAVLSCVLCLPSMAYFLAILIALQRRMRIFFKLYLIQAILFFGFSTAVATGLGFSAIPGSLKVIAACLAVMAVFQFFMALNLGEDFTFDKNRILLRGDPDISSGDEFMRRGNHYAREKMWAMAVVHFRRASYQFPNAVDPLLSLIVSYVNLEKYDFAADALIRAKKLDPAHPKVLGLTTLLAEKTQQKNPRSA